MQLILILCGCFVGILILDKLIDKLCDKLSLKDK